jgi:hypothetical protein
MEEASTVSKAIEQAWQRAGQPQEFSIKVLELPKTSFFGLKTAKSAKIAFFFNEATIKIREPQAAVPQKQIRPLSGRPQQSNRPEQQDQRTGQRRPQQGPRERDQQRPERREHAERPDIQRRVTQPQPNRPEQSEKRHEQRRNRPDERGGYRDGAATQTGDERPYQRQEYRSSEPREMWTPELIDAARDWLKETLVMMGHHDIAINSTVSHNYLKLNLSQPVLEDPRAEETQLKSWGSLAMEAVRDKAQKPLRSLRVILEIRK